MITLIAFVHYARCLSHRHTIAALLHDLFENVCFRCIWHVRHPCCDTLWQNSAHTRTLLTQDRWHWNGVKYVIILLLKTKKRTVVGIFQFFYLSWWSIFLLLTYAMMASLSLLMEILLYFFKNHGFVQTNLLVLCAISSL